MKKLWRFGGGVKLAGHKSLSNRTNISGLALPERLYIPVRQHIGDVAKPIVSVGDYVYKGQMIAESSSFISAPVHASSSGTVIEIGLYTIPHQSGIAESCVVIETDGLDCWHPDIQPADPTGEWVPDVIRGKIREAGIVGLGGAVFPSAAKLKPTRKIETLIVNGVECEPYITCDDVLMRSRSEEILRGIVLLRTLIHPQECIIAVEDNKPEAIKVLNQTIQQLAKQGLAGVSSVQVVEVPTLFPAGGEKQLIKVLTGKEVPQQGLPYEVGVVCVNVATAFAVYNAIYTGKPLISRLVTVTGPQVRRPANFEVLLGTPVEHLLKAAGGLISENATLIMGGPMMGQQLPHAQVPIVKASNCILVEHGDPLATPVTMPCIRCGTCASVCPIKLLPQQLYWHARAKAFNKLQHYNLADCIECGCCAVVCPSKIPLVHYFRFAKTAHAEQIAKAQFADRSRIRTQAREARLERIKREQEERKAKRKAARKRKLSSSNESSETPTVKVSAG